VQKDTLMTYEKGLFAQADPGIVSGSTIERKKMSTKTIYKRIALVAVAALGAGVLSVAPASAAAIVVANMDITGTASGDAAIIAGTAGTVINTTTGGATHGFRIANPSGTYSYIGSGYANPTVGEVVLSNTDATATLTFATTFLTAAQAGKWTVCIASDGTAADMNSLAKIEAKLTDAVVAAGTVAECESFFVYAASATFVGGLGRTVTAANDIIQDVTGQMTYFVVADTDSASYTVSVTGATIVSAWASNAGYTSATALTASATDTATSINGSNFTSGLIWTPTVKKGVLQVKVTNAAAGTSTLTVAPLSASGIPGTAVTAKGTWGASPTVGVAGSSSVSLIDASVGTPFAGAAADVVISAPSSAGTRQATIKLTLKDTQAVPAIIAAKAVTATVTGPGLVGGSVGTGTDNAYTDATVSNTRGRSITVNTDALGNAYFGVYGDGTSGVSTITITQGTTVVGTEKVTFYGAVASLKATVKRNIAATSAATTAALDVIAYDANNVVVPSVGITVTSGTPATIGSFNETTSAAADVVAGTAVVDVTGVTGKFGPVVLTIKDTATGLISTTATVNVGATEAKTVTASFDKATYTPGELVTLTISALDANGVAVGDTAEVASSYTILTNAAVQGTLPTGAVFKLGKQAITFYAPLVSGPLKADITLLATAAHAAAIQGTKISATAAVAVPANAEISALTTLVNSLIAKINALNKLVIKIQKKVRA
jgi:hypothetical protein